MGQDSFDRRVVERQRQVHAVFPSIIRGSRGWSQPRAEGRHRSVSHGYTSDDAPTPALNQSDPSEHELVTTLFDLGRQVTSVLDFDELLRQIPRLIGRLISFDAFAVYLLDERRGELRLAYAVGYPGAGARRSGCARASGLVGAAVASEQPLLVNDVAVRSALRRVRAGHAVGAGRAAPAQVAAHRRAEHPQPQPRSVHRCATSRSSTQFAAHVAVALVNARLFERSRQDAEAFETLAEIGREVASVLDLDELFARIAQLAKRVIDYRTFGILLVNDDDELEMKLAVKYGEKVEVPRVRARRGARRLRRASPRSRARRRRLAGSALHQARAGRALRAGDSAAAEGSLHRRRRSREPGARRVQQARRRDPHAARQPGGGGDRERAALRGGPVRRRSGSRRRCGSRSACRRRCCRQARPSG